jgi:hypothetical protein
VISSALRDRRNSPHRASLYAGVLVGLLVVALGGAVVSGEFRSDPASTVERTIANVAVSSPGVSRSAERVPMAEAIRTRWLTATTNVRSAPSAKAEPMAMLSVGSAVVVTSARQGRWSEIQAGSTLGWIVTDYLSTQQPAPVRSGPLSGPRCASGSGVEAGLQPATIAVHRAVCASFGAIARYGGLGSGEHARGYALDVMLGGTGLGSQIAAFLVANARQLGVTEVIWAQHIWTAERAGEGWRPMADRGSPTANHLDHVHVYTG